MTVLPTRFDAPAGEKGDNTMNTALDRGAPRRVCRATMNYSSGRGDGRPVTVEVDLLDGRQHAPEYDEAGFARIDHRSAVRDWRSAEEIDRVHAPEIREFVQAFSGCDRAIVYPAIVRSPVTAASEADYAPIEFVHSDFTEDYLPMVRGRDRAYRHFIEPLLAANGLTREALDAASRVALIQVWRNTGDAHPDRPFALCDKRCVGRDRLIASRVDTYGGLRLEFEAFSVTAPPGDRPDHWYTWPGMAADEALVFHTFDSALMDAGEAFWVPHSAFADPDAPIDAPRRESVEMRALCLWGI